MKHLFLFTALIAFCNFSFAAVRTVSNNPSNPAQFNNIQNAITASGTGDTIYVHGSSIPYPTFSLNKSNLTFIGSGFNPSKTLPITTIVDGISIIGNVTNISFIGFIFNGIFSITTGNSNFLIERCRLNASISLGSSNINNVILKSNVITNTNNNAALFFANCNTITNILISNNVFYSTATNGTNAPLISIFSFCGNALMTPGITFENNIFQRVQPGSEFISTAQNTVLVGGLFKNNIFINFNPDSPILGGASYINNLTTTNVDLNNPVNGVSSSGNVVNADPLFQNLPAGAAYSTSHKFNLLPGSPAIGAGFGGFDIGALGGISPFQHDGEPLIPQIDEFVIFNPTVPAGSTIQVKLKGTALE